MRDTFMLTVSCGLMGEKAGLKYLVREGCVLYDDEFRNVVLVRLSLYSYTFEEETPKEIGEACSVNELNKP